VNSATRHDWQLALEKSIQTFNADAVEAMELLDALIGTLAGRYDAGQLSDIQHVAAKLRGALDELDTTMTDKDAEEILAESQYRDWVATKEEEVHG
jgi:hypothetical protein